MQLSPQQQALLELANLRGMAGQQPGPDEGGSPSDFKVPWVGRVFGQGARESEPERAMRELKAGYASVGKTPPGAVPESDIGNIVFRTPPANNLAGLGQGARTPPAENVMGERIVSPIPTGTGGGEGTPQWVNPAQSLRDLAMTPTATPARAVLPRVDIATASAVAMDRGRTGRSLEDLYRDRGYEVAYEGNDQASQQAQQSAFEANLKLRARQGDSWAIQTLMAQNPGEGIGNILRGTTRGEQRRDQMAEQRMNRRELIDLGREEEDRRRNYGREDAATAQRSRMEIVSEEQKGRMELQKIVTAGQTEAQKVEAAYKQGLLSVEQLRVANQAIAQATADKMAAAQLALQTRQVDASIDQAKVAQGTQLTQQQLAALEVEKANAIAEGRPVNLVAAGISVPGSVAPVNPVVRPEILMKRLSDLGIPNEQTAYRKAMEQVMDETGAEPGGINIQMPWQNRTTGRPLFRDQSPANNPTFKATLKDKIQAKLEFMGLRPAEAARVVAQFTPASKGF